MNYSVGLLLLLTVGIMSTSCTSEYEERLEQGRFLKEKLSIVEQSYGFSSNDRLTTEIEDIRNEINLLAIVSGNEELFLEELFAD